MDGRRIAAMPAASDIAALGGVASAVAPPARIGPNAVTQVAAVLVRDHGQAFTVGLFAQAGIARHLAEPPRQMIDEAEVVRLHRVLRAELGVPEARRVGACAGRGTGDYLLAHRIPGPVQTVLKRLPATLAARVLLAAIRRHAWTFAGAGSFDAAPGAPWRLVIRNGPIARGDAGGEPLCDFYAATFERLFGALAHPRARVVETQCSAQGAPACVFEVRW
jgi:divinyl protochlorophyllide a 8-vinyl-reductase